MTVEQLCEWADVGPAPAFDETRCDQAGTTDVAAAGRSMLYCDRHAQITRALEAMRGIRADLITTVHAWVDGRATVEELRAIATQDVDARARLRRVVPGIGE